MSFYYRDYGLKSPIKRAKELGSAHSGVHHWWGLKLSALALIPLGIWFIYAVVSLAGADIEIARTWIAVPWNALILSALVIAAFYHAALGGAEVFLDYVPNKLVRIPAMIIFYTLCFAGGAISLFSILSIAL